MNELELFTVTDSAHYYCSPAVRYYRVCTKTYERLHIGWLLRISSVYFCKSIAIRMISKYKSEAERA